MKNLILFFVAFCISLCTFGQSLAMSDFYDSASSANGSLGEPRSMVQAEEIARNFLLGHSPTGHSSHVPRYVDVSRMQLLRSADVLRKASISTMKLADDAFYVFTDPQGSTPGFVIVSTDESMDPILGFSYENCFVPDSLPEHIAAWLASYAIEYAQQISTDGCQGQSRLRAKSPEYSGSVDPILSVKWNQTDPYNRMCPVADGARTVTGCVATAMAQVMSVHQSPAAADGHISYTTSSKRIPIDEDLSRFHFDWNSIMNNHSAGFSSAVADLMYAVGVSVRMDYTTEGSGTSDVYIPTALHDNFGYDADMLLCEKSSMTNDEWYQLLISELKQGRPVVYSGITNSRSGHCFVTDGYRVESGEPKFHINWGWAGNCDGYYRIANLRPESAGVGGVNEAYSLSNSAVIGIKPDDGYQEHNGFWQARSITAMPAVVSPNSSDEVVITCSSLTNASLRDFEGSFAYYLVDNEGHATLLDTKNVSGKMGYHHVLSTMSHSLRVPSGLALGNYTIEVRSVSNGIERRVTSGMGDARIIVSEAKVAFPTDMMVAAVIPHPKSGRTVELEAVNPLNNSSTPFKGDLSMAITDTDGHIIQRIGNVVTLSSLEHWLYYTRSFVFSGSIPYDIPDGNYRLCLVSCQEGYDDWSTVHRYTATSWNGSVYLDQLSLDGYVGLSIKNGLVNYDYSTMPHYAPQIVIQGSLQLASAQGRSATLSAQIGNVSSTSFFGEVRAAIADSRGNVLERSASNGLIVATELAQNRVYTNPQAITGLFSGTYADGEYKLVLLANQGGCADWSAVNSYNGGSSSCPIWIKDNCLYTSSVIDSSVLKSGSCGTNARYTIYDNLTMTITGTGAMDNYGKTGNVAPWREANLHGNIQSVSVAEGITSLGDYAFYDCSSLSQVEFPTSLRRIGESAFEGSSLGLLTLPQSIETLAEGACTGISHVDVAAGNANFASDHGVLYSADFKTLYYYPSSYQGPFVVPATVTAIAGKAFAAAGELTELRLPASLCSIGSDAFAQCKGLQCIYCMATTPPSVGNSAFLQVRKNIPVYVPAESIAVYGRASGWADFTSLKAYVVVQNIVLPFTTVDIELHETLHVEPSFNPVDATEVSIAWSSSNTEIASVDNSGNVTPHKFGTAIITARAVDVDGVESQMTVNVVPSMVKSITLNTEILELHYGEKAQLEATIEPEYATEKSVVWTSSDETIATVDENGLVTAQRGVGTATITATTTDGTELRATCNVTVLGKPDVGYNPYLSSRVTRIQSGNFNGRIMATYTYELRNNGSETIEVTKCTVMDADTRSILSTTSNGSELGTLEPDNAITRQQDTNYLPNLAFEWEYIYNGKTYVFQSWERYYADAESIVIDQTAMTLERGTTGQLKATVLPTVAINEVKWSTSDAKVATVDNTGLVTAVGLGTATISATTTDETDLSATCEVTVVPVAAKSVTLSTDKMDVVIGDAFTITATVEPENAESKDIAWSIDNTDVVRMTAEGEFEAIGIGNATITATVLGTEVSTSCEVTVLPILVSEITLSQTAAEMTKGETLQLVADVAPANTTNATVRWTSSDTSVAEVDENGLVTAKTGGTAVITATACDGSGVIASCKIVVIGKPDYGYNPYLSSRTTGYSYTTFTGYMYGFELRNNGNEEIEVTKCTIKDAATLATLSVGTDANMLGSLAPGNAISLSFKTWNESSFAFEWEYLYNDKTYVFKSWEHYYADAETVTLSETTMAIEIGTTSQLKATILPSVAMQEVKWTSSDESIASVDAEGHVTGINIGKALITATTTDDTDLEAQCVVSVIPQKIMPTGLRLSVTEITAAIDEHFTITATIEPEDSDFKQIEWTISNPNVIEMLADGEFVATSIGTATITATIVGTGVSATCEVTTYDPNVFAYYLKVKDQDLYLAIDSEDNDGRTNNVISAAHLSVKEKASLLIITEETEGWKIEDAVTHRVLGKSTRYSWNFSNMDTDAALWSVEPSDDALLLRGSNGYWKTNSVADGSYLYHDGRPRDLLWELIPVRETDISMEINCTSASLHVGESKQLTVAIVPLQVLQGGILWSSNNNAVATVSEEGLVTAISLGTAIITATLESNPEVKAMATITVKPIGVTSITLDKTSCELVLGQTATIKASINPTDATDKGILWSTDNALIATVTSNGTVKAVGKGTTTITATSKSNPDIKATLKVTVKATDVTSISLNKTACQIKVGESEELIATIAPNTATDKGIVWTSSNKTVATVSANGIVTALAEGTTTITASSHSNPEVKATATVQVVNNVKVESIYLNIEEFTIEVGYNRTLTVGFVPANADNTGISWISDNTTIARVDPVTGKIIGVSEGTAVITATSNDNPDAKVSVTVHVIDRNVKSITLNYTEYELWPGESVKLEAVVSPDNAKSKNVVWSTDNANVATVSSNGTVKAVAPGIVTITAKSDVNSKVSATATITVLGLATDISLNYSSYALAKGESVQLVAYVSPDVASQQPITWSSSNEGIITVNANGLCTCIGDGTATVTATTTDGSELSASCVFGCVVGIENLTADNSDDDVFSIDGIKRNKVQQGVNIIRRKDGKSIKILN